MLDSWMGKMQSRSVSIVAAGMVLVVFGVVHGAFFVPGIWVLILGFVALVTTSLFAMFRDRS